MSVVYMTSGYFCMWFTYF